MRVTPLETEAGQRMRVQARALARLEHPGLLHVLDTVEGDGVIVVVTEELPPLTLAAELDQEGRLDPTAAVQAAVEVGEALATLHRSGFAHGGVSIQRIGRTEHGRALLLDGPPTGDSVSIPATPRGDLRSLALVTHQLVVGHPPLIAPDGNHDLHPDIPPILQPVLQRALDEDEPWTDTTAFVLALGDTVPFLPATPKVTERQASFFQAERAWFAPVGLLLLVATLLILVGVVIARSQVARSVVDNAKEVVDFDSTASTSPPSTTTPSGSGAPTATLDIVDIVDFDPSGDDRAEHPERVAFINQQAADGGWHTERYTTRDFGNLKTGVGLIVSVGPPQQLDRLRISSPTLGWSVEVYAADGPAGTVTEWGEPVATADGLVGDAVVTLGGTEATTILIWITDLGDELEAGGHRVTITDIEIDGRPLFG